MIKSQIKKLNQNKKQIIVTVKNVALWGSECWINFLLIIIKFCYYLYCQAIFFFVCLSDYIYYPLKARLATSAELIFLLCKIVF